MQKKIFPAIAFFITMLSSCSEGKNATFEKQYIDLQSVIQDAVMKNEKSNTAFLKKVWINDEQETVTVNNPDWSKELEVFYLADLNKRDYLNKYATDSSKFTLTYSLLPKMEAPVKELIVRFDSARNVSDVKATLTTDNFLYESKRELQLQFLDKQLIGYEVDGWQELFIGDKKTYKLQATKKED